MSLRIRLATFIAWRLPRLHAAYWRVRRFLRRPALVISLTDDDGVQREELHVYSGHTELRRVR